MFQIFQITLGVLIAYLTVKYVIQFIFAITHAIADKCKCGLYVDHVRIGILIALYGLFIITY